MAGMLIIEGLGVVLAAAAAPAAVVADPPQAERAAIPVAYSAATPRVRTRDERIGAAALRGFPASDGWVPPAKSWGEGTATVIEIGALGARRSWQPDLAHVSFAWQF